MSDAPVEWRPWRLDCPDCDFHITAHVTGADTGVRLIHDEAGHSLKFPPSKRPTWFDDLDLSGVSLQVDGPRGFGWSR